MWFFSVSEATADPAWKLFSAEVFRHRWRWNQLFRYLSFFRAVVVSMWSTIIVEPNKRDDDDDDGGDSGSYNVDGNHRAIFFPLKSFHFTNLFFFQISLFSIPPSCFATSAKPGNPLRLLREFFFPLIVQYPQRRWRLDRWKKLPRNSENEIGDKSFKIPSKSRKIEFSVKVD